MNPSNPNIPTAYLHHVQSGYSLLIGWDGVSIGRHPTNRVVIPESHVSRFHAHIFYSYGHFWIRDLDSKTGIFLNGHRIQNQAEIIWGDKIIIGNSEFILQRHPMTNLARPSHVTRRNEKKNALVYLGILAVSLLILFGSMTFGGVGGPTKSHKLPDTIPSEPVPIPIGEHVRWGQTAIHASLFTGTSQSALVDFQVTENLVETDLVASPEISSLVQFVFPEMGALEVGEAYQLEVILACPEATSPGNYSGFIQLRSLNQPVESVLHVNIEVSEPDATRIPAEVSIASQDKLVKYSEGYDVVKDLLVVGLDLDTANAEARIREIAVQTGGVFLGSIPEILTYQMRFPVNNLADLQRIKQQITGLPDVAFASREFFGEYLQKKPDDKEYKDEKWDPANTSGTNWHLNMIHAPAAWDLQTGSSSVKIGVVDVGINPRHSDLRENIRSAHGKEQIYINHGTHVSGLIAAKGNNGKGVSGVMWDASLQVYDIEIGGDIKAGFSATSAAEKMTEAVSDGNRIINLSIGGGQKKCTGTEGQDAPQDIIDMVAEDNAIFSQPILYALNESKDVLWVISAGNEKCDVRNTSPASLVQNFPLNVITVASVNKEGKLSDFSNRGELVSVAAPGGNGDPSQRILSTVTNCLLGRFFCFGNYGEKAGTSMSAPIVSGIAGLVLAQHPDYSATQIKQCILAGAKTRNHKIDHQTFYLADAELAVKCQGELDLPNKVDIIISIDLTASMKDELERIKKEIIQVIENLRTKASPSTDFRFGVVSFEDYPADYNSAVCGYSNYFGTYGSESSKYNGDLPYRLELPLTDDQNEINAAIQSLELGNGEDPPESYGRVFWEIGQAAKNNQMNFRSDARKLVLSFGDSVPHDPDLDEGLGLSLLKNTDTGIDPGPDDEINCTNDTSLSEFDLDFQDNALQALIENNVRLLHVDSSGEEALIPYWQYWTSLTGGAFLPINPDGTIPGGISLSELIVQLLQLSTP